MIGQLFRKTPLDPVAQAQRRLEQTRRQTEHLQAQTGSIINWTDTALGRNIDTRA